MGSLVENKCNILARKGFVMKKILIGLLFLTVSLIAQDGDLDTAFGANGVVTYSGDYFFGLFVQPDGKSVALANGHLVRYLGDGSLDNSFGTNGVVTTGPMLSNEVIVLSDGSIITVGTISNNVLIQKYLSNGVLDTSFGSNGVISQNIDGLDRGFALAAQKDGKILVGAYRSGGSASILMRYTASGQLDTTFAGTGIVSPYVGGAVDSIRVRPDGKILAAGEGLDGGTANFKCVRYLPDGTKDITFGTNGVATVSVAADEIFNQIVLHPNGSIFAVGYGQSSGNCDVKVVKLQSDGQVDTSFGVNGIATVDLDGQGCDLFSGDDEAYAIVLQPDGKIVVAGRDGNHDSSLKLIRLLPDGTLDQSFGIGGIVSTDVTASGDAVRAIRVQSDGKIIVAGLILNFMGGALARYVVDSVIVSPFVRDLRAKYSLVQTSIS